MKHLIIILILLFAQTSTAQEKLRLHKTDFNVYGDVESFTSKTQNYANPNDLNESDNTIFIQNDPDFISEYHFDKEGFLYESKTQDKGYTWKKYEFSGSPINPLVTKITALRKTKPEDHFQPDYTIIIEYKNQSAYVTTISENGEKQTIRRYYDRKGNVIKEHLIPKGKKVFTYAYDDENRLKERKRRDKEKYSKYQYEWDENTNILKKTETNQDEETIVSTYENKLIKSYTNPEYTMKYTYEFDKNGNWIKCLNTMNGILISQEFREIRYRQ